MSVQERPDAPGWQDGLILELSHYSRMVDGMTGARPEAGRASRTSKAKATNAMASPRWFGFLEGQGV
jgi:hypothetical protein